MMHPFLFPGEWLVNGIFFDPVIAGQNEATGIATVRAEAQFPEILQVTVELQEVGEISYAPAQTTSYHLEIFGERRVKFRMDSISLGTVLIGEGAYTSRSLTLGYRSPEGRYTGFESFVRLQPGRLIACGSFMADQVSVKTWEVLMERVGNAR